MAYSSAENYSRNQASLNASCRLNDAGAINARRKPDFAPLEKPAPLVAKVPAELAGERLDKALASLFPIYSRRCLQNWLKAGRVRIDGLLASLRQPAPGAATVVLEPDWLPEQQAFAAEPVPLEIVYEDETLVVLNKPAGLVVHPAAGNWRGTLLNGLLHRYGAAAAALPRAGIVHRLDKETSGLMVAARTLAAQTALVRQLQAHTVRRCYIALVWGAPASSGSIDAPLGRHRHDRIRMAVVKDGTGRPARTHYRTLAVSEAAGALTAAVQCELETGRTHQIRVHFAHLGHPLIGDPLYGRARPAKVDARLPAQAPGAARAASFARQALHAWRLELAHPLNGQLCAWRAPAPADLTELAADLGLSFELAAEAISAKG